MKRCRIRGRYPGFFDPLWQISWRMFPGKRYSSWIIYGIRCSVCRDPCEIWTCKMSWLSFEPGAIIVRRMEKRVPLEVSSEVPLKAIISGRFLRLYRKARWKLCVHESRWRAQNASTGITTWPRKRRTIPRGWRSGSIVRSARGILGTRKQSDRWLER